MTHEGQVAILAPQQLRTAPRRVVNFTAYVRETGAKVVLVPITDISTDGCKLLSNVEFETATPAWLKIVGVGARQVRIIWREAGAYGCEFLHPLSREVVAELCTATERSLRKNLQSERRGFGRAA